MNEEEKQKLRGYSDKPSSGFASKSKPQMRDLRIDPEKPQPHKAWSDKTQFFLVIFVSIIACILWVLFTHSVQI